MIVSVPTTNPFVVSSAGDTSYKSIQSAIDAAATEFGSSGITQTVQVRAGTYTEDLTIKNGVLVVSDGVTPYATTAAGALAQSGSVIVSGNHTFAVAAAKCQSGFKGIVFDRNDGAELLITSADLTNGADVQFEDCAFVDSSTASEVMVTLTDAGAAGGQYTFSRCGFFADTPNLLLNVDATLGATCVISDTYMENASGTEYGLKTTSKSSTALLVVFRCQTNVGVSIASGGAGVFVEGSIVANHSAGAVGIAAGAACTLQGVTVQANNSPAVEGDGTLYDRGSMFDTTNVASNTVTVNHDRVMAPGTVQGTYASNSSTSYTAGRDVLVLRHSISGAPSSVVLPDPDVLGVGSVVTIAIDGDAQKYPVTVTTPTGALKDGGTLSRPGGLARYLSIGSTGYIFLGYPLKRESPYDYIVDASGEGTHLTIQSAITDGTAKYVSEGDIVTVGIVPDYYTEDLTWNRGVYLYALDGPRTEWQQGIPTSNTWGVTIEGNHEIDNGSEALVYAKGIQFVNDDGGAPIIDFDGDDSGGFIGFDSCMFRDLSATTTTMFSSITTTGGDEQSLQMNDCVIAANTTTAVMTLGGAIKAAFRDCRITNVLTAPALVATASTTAGVDVLAHGCHFGEMVQIAASVCTGYFRNCEFNDTTGVHALRFLGDVTYEGCSFTVADPADNAVDGTADAFVRGGNTYATNVPYGTSGGGTYMFTARGQQAESACTVTEVTTTPYDASPWELFLKVDTTGGAINVRLPDASKNRGLIVTVVDYGGVASSNKITVTSPSTSGGVEDTLNGGVISLDGAAMTLRSSDDTWWVIAFNGG